MHLCALAAALWTSPVQGEVWSGDFTLTIQGSGKAKGPAPNTGNWKIMREARGTIVLDRSFEGGGIAGTHDTRNTKRYKTWIADTKRPIELRIHDTVGIYGPLFAANQIRQDTIKFNCPVEPGDAWQTGKVASAILQLDFEEGTYTFETPRFYGKGEEHFYRAFVAGPPSWVSKKPIDKHDAMIEFEVIYGLVQPSEWFKMSGPFKTGQDKIDLTRSIPFKVNLGASVKAQDLKAEFKLVLEKIKR